MITTREEFLLKICRRLSMQCRYGGDVRRFYSVAEHTCHMVRQGREDGLAPDTLLQLWLHDTPEDVLGDLLPKVKKHHEIAPIVKGMEQDRMAEICHGLGLPQVRGVSALVSKTVKLYDDDITAAEAKFTANPQPGWAPFDDQNEQHVNFGVRLQNAAPYGHRFEYWAFAMAQEFDLITEGLSK